MELKDDSVAIVGVGCRFPGADNLDDFWRVLTHGENHVIDIPSTRWRAEAFYDPDPEARGKTYVNKAGLLSNHDLFDNRFFGINDIEAERMDPQQRYALECTHMALENGGFTKAKMAGTKTGVFVGVMNYDYWTTGGDALEASSVYSVSGQSTGIVAARVSYVYDLRGPSLTLDTACSSSLVALHLGAQAITSGDCDMAVCGGVNSLLVPDPFVHLSSARMVSRTGQSQAFSKTADGYARGEGCGIVLLKRLGEALRDKDRIWAVIGTGCNQDGRTATPLTAPSGVQQEKLLRDVFSKFKVDPRDVTYIEAHGTGTPIGDPTEVNALGRFLESKDRLPVLIGSVKTNVGHLESAAGMAGLIKVLLMIKHKTFVPTLLFSDPNPKIDFDRYGLRICTEVSEWKVAKGKAIVASVNSFGFGGTNSHAIVQEYRANADGDTRFPASHVSRAHLGKQESATLPSLKEQKPERSSVFPVILSAPTKEGLKGTVNAFFNNLEDSVAERDIQDISYTTITRRDLHDYRLVVFARDLQNLIRQKTQAAEQAKQVTQTGKSPPKLVFLFCGVGTTWNGMCKQLLATNRTFKEMTDRIDKLLTQMDRTLSMGNLLENGGDVTDPLEGQLAIFICQLALFELWRHLGVRPNVIVGQSVGEVAAAYSAGILCLEDAVRVMYQRSNLLKEATGGRMMVIAQYPVDKVEEMCSKLQHRVVIAVHSSKKACTVSGDADAVLKLKKNIMEDVESGSLRPVFYELNVQCAYHSHHVEGAAKALEETIADLKGKKNTFPIVSSVTGKMAREGDLGSPKYWHKNTRNPVLFHQALSTAVSSCRSNDSTPVVILEIGPRPVARAHLADIFPGSPVVSLPSMLAEKELDTLTKTAADLFKQGVPVAFENFTEMDGYPIDIPRYTFNRVRPLFISDGTLEKLRGERKLQAGDAGHPFVEQSPGKQTEFLFRISPSSTPFVYDHIVGGSIAVQGATHAEIGLAIGEKIWKIPAHLMTVTLTYKKLILLKPDDNLALTVSTVIADSEDSIEFTVRTKSTLHAKGIVRKSVPNEREPPRIQTVRARCTQQKDEADIYEALHRELKVDFGKTTRILKRAFYNGQECLAEVRFPEELRHQLCSTSLHPCLLDALAQASVLLSSKSADTSQQLWLPAGIEQVVARRPSEPEMFLYLENGKQTETKRYYNGLLLTQTGSVVAEMKNLLIETKARGMQALEAANEYELAWVEVFPETPSAQQQSKKTFWLVGSETSSTNTCAAALRGHTTQVYKAVDAFEKDFCSLPTERLSHIDSIIFCAPSRPALPDATSACKQAQDDIWALITLIQILSKMAANIRLCIVTHNCQCLDQARLPVVPIQPLGAALWGCTRSAIQEFTYDRLHLIDLTEANPSELQMLATILAGESPGLLDSMAEVKLVKDRVYSTDFVWKESPTTTRSKSLVVDSSLPLKVLSLDKTIEGHFACKVSEPMQVMRDDTVEIRVKRAFLHEEAISPLTVKPFCGERDFAVDTGTMSYDIMVFEIEGKVTRIGRTVTEAVIGDTVVAVSPVRAGTLIRVAEQNVINISASKNYKLGTALNFSLLFLIVDCTPEKARVAVIHSQFSVNQAIVLVDILRKQRGCEADCVEGSKFVRTQTSPEVIIFLKDVIPEDLESVTDGFAGVKKVIFPTHFISKDVQRFLRLKCGDLQVTELNFERQLLDGVALKQSTSRIKQWMNDYSDLTEQSPSKEIFKSDALLTNLDETAVLNVEVITNSTENMLPETPEKVILKSGAYVVTGGHSGLGWEMMKMLAAAGAGTVVCTSRNKPSEALTKELKLVGTRYDCQVISVQCDVTDQKSVQNLIKTVRRSTKRTLRGIFHCAAVFDDALLVKMTKTKLSNVFGPKITGTLNLHACTQSLSLDFFVVSSSIAAILGNNGQTGYAAANAFQDSMMYFRRQQGLAGQTVNWGALDLGTVERNKHIRENLQLQGWGFLTVDEIARDFSFCLKHDRIQYIFSKIDWRKVIMKAFLSHGQRQHLAQKYRTIAAALRPEENDRSGRNKNTELPSALEGMHKQKTSAKQAMTKAMSEVFLIDEIQPEAYLFSLGINSVLVLSFIDRVSQLTGVTLPIGMLLDDSTTVGQAIEHVKAAMPESTDISTSEGTSLNLENSQENLMSSKTSQERDRDVSRVSRAENMIPKYARTSNSRNGSRVELPLEAAVLQSNGKAGASQKYESIHSPLASFSHETPRNVVSNREQSVDHQHGENKSRTCSLL